MVTGTIMDIVLTITLLHMPAAEVDGMFQLPMLIKAEGIAPELPVGLQTPVLLMLPVAEEVLTGR